METSDETINKDTFETDFKIINSLNDNINVSFTEDELFHLLFALDRYFIVASSLNFDDLSVYKIYSKLKKLYFEECI